MGSPILPIPIQPIRAEVLTSAIVRALRNVDKTAARGANCGDIAAGPGSENDEVAFHDGRTADFACSIALRPFARAVNVRELTRSSKSMTSFRFPRGIPCVMKMICVRWSLSGHRSSQVNRVKQMLGALNDRRTAWLLGDIDEPLHPQEPRAEILPDPVKQKLQLFARQRRLARQHEALDRLVLKVIERESHVRGRWCE